MTDRAVALCRRAPFVELSFGAFAALLVVLAMLPTGDSVTDQTISTYALGPYGELIRVALLCLGLGSYVVAAGFWRALRGPYGLALAALACVWATGCVLDSWVDTNPPGRTTTSGQIHLMAAFAAFAALIVAAFVFVGWAWRRTGGVPRGSVLTTAFVLAACGAQLAATDRAFDAWGGMVERLVFASSICWMLAAARLVQRTIQAASDQPDPV
jgi:hypothetical protein